MEKKNYPLEFDFSKAIEKGSKEHSGGVVWLGQLYSAYYEKTNGQPMAAIPIYCDSFEAVIKESAVDLETLKPGSPILIQVIFIGDDLEVKAIRSR
mgnify:CR=1 FL=1